ncbi:2062_t:CDS:2 [Dentiscutata erythropus]|uniref:2062_t:CDS:1 n=1 Tax=Dentiscutata erythropus TaxID=1348616 RepID=A0A9N8ZJK0_9GLOM|nr:2062_t:CDS:2 [Dentiscutata erythropus]
MIPITHKKALTSSMVSSTSGKSAPKRKAEVDKRDTNPNKKIINKKEPQAEVSEDTGYNYKKEKKIIHITISSTTNKKKLLKFYDQSTKRIIGCQYTMLGTSVGRSEIVDRIECITLDTGRDGY